MATSKTLTPTNVTIQIPAMTDAPDQSVNSNCIDKLGDAVNTLNSKMTTAWIGNNTLANIQAALLTLAGDMADGERKGIEFGISTVSGYFGATNYIGVIERISASRLCVHVMCAMFTSQMIIGNYKDGTWYWDEAAKASQLVKTVKVTYTPSSNIAAGESGYFTVPVPSALRGKTIVAVSFGVNHVAQSYGYQLTGTYISTLDDAYVSYYAPRAITAANADFDMTIAYI